MTGKSISSLDDLRREQPDLGAALYAYEPDGDVVLEIHTPDGQVYAFSAPSEAAALAMAFPQTDQDAPAEPAINIFD